MKAEFNHYAYTVLERFLRYVKIDTQSDPESNTFPSTEKQKDLARLLLAELQSLGLESEMDEYGYVYATLPSNVSKKIPVICFCSHMDTSPDCSGAHVKPIVHMNYDGGVIHLPEDPNVQIDPAEHPDLRDQVGNDLVTADGTTLLGADNKSGVAAIMDALHFLVSHPEIPHGTIKIVFTPDEEIGRGVNHIDLKKLGADFGYTVDGESRGTLENETFSADGAKVTFHGISTHPGYAKDKMVNAIKVASAFIQHLPAHRLSPETTEGREGFVHPLKIEGSIERCEVQLILRDFETELLKDHAYELTKAAEKATLEYPGSRFEIAIHEQYRNMKEIVDQHPHIVSFAHEALLRAELKPHLRGIRGGTDGSRLSFMGLPCPNIFAGEHAFHSKMEWVSVQDMQKAVQTIVHIVCIAEEQNT